MAEVIEPELTYFVSTQEGMTEIEKLLLTRATEVEIMTTAFLAATPDGYVHRLRKQEIQDLQGNTIFLDFEETIKTPRSEHSVYESPETVTAERFHEACSDAIDIVQKFRVAVPFDWEGMELTMQIDIQHDMFTDNGVETSLDIEFPDDETQGRFLEKTPEWIKSLKLVGGAKAYDFLEKRRQLGVNKTLR